MRVELLMTVVGRTRAEDRPPGCVIDVEEPVGRSWIARGIAKAADAEGGQRGKRDVAAGTGNARDASVEVADDLMSALLELAPDDKPTVSEISDLLDRKVSGSELTAAWKAYQATAGEE